MDYFRASKSLVVLSVLVLSLGEISFVEPQNRMMKQFPPIGNKFRGPPVMCFHDTLLVYQDCRMCVCPRPNRIAKCFKKSCDLRTKDSGQCPPAILRIDDGKCALTKVPACKIDAHCPGDQLCCFDFCGGARCTNPIPLDVTTGQPVHSGRGFQKN